MKTGYARPAAAHGAPLDDVRPSLEMTFRGHRQSVLGVDMQPTSAHSILASSSYQKSSEQTHALPPKTVSCGADGSILLWDAKPTSRALRLVGHRGPVMSCAFSPKALVIASSGHDGYVRIWVPDLRRAGTSFPGKRVLTQGAAVRTGTAPMSSSTIVDSADADGSVAFKAHSNGAARALAFATDGSDVLYTVGDDKGIKAWDLNYVSTSSGTTSGSTSRFLGSFLGGHANWVRCVSVQKGQTAPSHAPYVATGGDDGAVCLWDARTRHLAHRFAEHDGGIRSLAFHPGGYQVASGDVNGAINVYDVRYSSSSSSYGLVQHYRNAHGSTGNAVCGLDFCPKGHWLLSAGDDALVKLWDTLEGYLYCAMEAHDGPVRACKFSHDGQFFTTGGVDKIVMVWRSGLPGRSAAYSPPSSGSAPAPSTVMEASKASPRQPLLSTTMLTAATHARLTRAKYGGKGDVHGVIASRSSPHADPEEAHEEHDVDDVAARTAPPSRDRSFERDEARCSRIGDTHGHTDAHDVAPSQGAEEKTRSAVDPREGGAAAEAGAAAALSSGQPRRVRFSENASPSSTDATAAVNTLAVSAPAGEPPAAYDARIANLERAVAVFGQTVREELLAQRRETDALRESWEQSQVQHRDDIQKLMTMMAQLVQQQTILVSQRQHQQ